MVTATDTGLVTEGGLVVPVRVGIKRSNGLDGVVSEHVAQDVDEVRKAEVVGENKFDGLLEKYENFLSDISDFKFKKEVTDVLTPDEINQFLQATVTYEDYEEYSPGTGQFISQLIQNSYDSGYNNFELNTESLGEIDKLGNFFTGKEDDTLNLTIKGNIGDNSFSYVQNCNITVHGNVGKYFASGQVLVGEKISNNCKFTVYGNVGMACGVNDDNSTIIIHGNAGPHLGQNSKNSKITVHGNVTNLCASGSSGSNITIYGNVRDYLGCNSKGSTFIIHGEVGDTDPSEMTNSTFKTSNAETLKKLLMYDDLQVDGTPNNFYFIEKDGTEILVRGKE